MADNETAGRCHRQRCPFCQKSMVGGRKWKRHVRDCGDISDDPLDPLEYIEREIGRLLHTGSSQERGD